MVGYQYGCYKTYKTKEEAIAAFYRTDKDGGHNSVDEEDECDDHPPVVDLNRKNVVYSCKDGVIIFLYMVVVTLIWKMHDLVDQNVL